MRRQQLEIALSHLKPSPSPQLAYEAYDLDPSSAAEVLFLAESRFGDVKDRAILDLGCGSGILAIGAALMGAEMVVGVDINLDSVEMARTNARLSGASVQLVAGDIEAVRGPLDVTIMNPPFGTRLRGIDVKFLRKAMSVSVLVYSLHKTGEQNRVFLRNAVEKLGGEVDAIFNMELEIPRTYEFHTKKRYQVKADLYRVISSVQPEEG